MPENLPAFTAEILIVTALLIRPGMDLPNRSASDTTLGLQTFRLNHKTDAAFKKDPSQSQYIGSVQDICQVRQQPSTVMRCRTELFPGYIKR
jgi:hypothetical protein